MTEPLNITINNDDVLRYCQELVRFDTTNPPGNELAAAQFVLDELAKFGFEGELIDEGEGRANCIARLRGSGEMPAIMFNGHLDVVPVGKEPWKHPPFAAEVADGKVWGRGSSDMKGGIASMMAAAAAVAKSGYKLKGDLVVTGTAGEEVNMQGARTLAKYRELGPLKAVIISEPTKNTVALAERGVLWPEITTHGKTAHGSTPELGINAIHMMIALLAEIEKTPVPFEPHPLLGDFTRSLNLLQGGVKTNVVPDSCTVVYDYRTVPGQDHELLIAQLEDICDKMKLTYPDFNATVRVLNNLPAAETKETDAQVLSFIAAASEALGKPVGSSVMKFATEACIFVPELNAPSIVLGPGRPELAHQPNEFIDIEPMYEAARIYAYAAIRMLS